ncbi:MAG: sulfurtransferase-like selenium metabolism protein YedF [Deltaproteobacteria bacterium]
MGNALDCRGLACPAPVLQTKELIETEDPAEIRVTVDNEAAKQNVTRFLDAQHFHVSVMEKGADFEVIGTRDNEAPPPLPVADGPEEEKRRIMVMVATDRVGFGDDVLGRKLMTSFLSTLKELGEELWRLVFVNNGVKLTIEGSDILPMIQDLEKEGTGVLVCGTCLTHFDLLDRKGVGETTNMLDIVTAMQLADKVINI